MKKISDIQKKCLGMIESFTEDIYDFEASNKVHSIKNELRLKNFVNAMSDIRKSVNNGIGSDKEVSLEEQAEIYSEDFLRKLTSVNILFVSTCIAQQMFRQLLNDDDINFDELKEIRQKLKNWPDKDYKNRYIISTLMVDAYLNDSKTTSKDGSDKVPVKNIGTKK